MEGTKKNFFLLSIFVLEKFQLCRHPLIFMGPFFSRRPIGSEFVIVCSFYRLMRCNRRPTREGRSPLTPGWKNDASVFPSPRIDCKALKRGGKDLRAIPLMPNSLFMVQRLLLPLLFASHLRKNAWHSFALRIRASVFLYAAQQHTLMSVYWVGLALGSTPFVHWSTIEKDLI